MGLAVPTVVAGAPISTRSPIGPFKGQVLMAPLAAAPIAPRASLATSRTRGHRRLRCFTLQPNGSPRGLEHFKQSLNEEHRSRVTTPPGLFQIIDGAENVRPLPRL